MIVVVLAIFFTGMETAFLSADKLRLKLDLQSHPLPAKMLRLVLHTPRQFIATTLMGNTLSLVIYTLALAVLLLPLLLRITGSAALAALLLVILATVVILLVTELPSKTLFRFFPNWLLTFLAFPFAVFFVLFYPLTRFSLLLSGFLLRHFLPGKEMPEAENLVFSRIDLDHFIGETDQAAATPENEVVKEVQLFRNALDFSKVKLREIMVPRNEISMLDIHSSVEQLRQKFIETGYSRILFYEDNVDNIVGYVHSSAIFKKPTSIKPFLKNVLIVPETMAANKLLSRFIREHRSIALVVDEFGGTSGLVTSEDILEEIFGEIEDEHDTSDYVEKKLSDHEYIFSGRFEIDLLNEKYQLGLPESEEFETLAGFILFHHESIPKANSVIKIGRFGFKILKASRTKIELVHLTVSED